ncbi:MAG TPA: hypothetical protein VFJ43_12350, partial [Bacteroidia bacterium]|nr:hypothetical protein [Bacteroidia bacterium]
MKKNLFIFSCAFFMSCSSSTNSSTTNAAAASPVDTTHPAVDTKHPVVKIDSMDYTDTTTKDFGKIGEELLKNENVSGLKLGLSKEKTIALIGEPDSKSAATEWGADGLFHQ